MITDSEAAYNGIGYSGTNTGGNLDHQGLGVARQPHRDRAQQRRRREARRPSTSTTIVGNLVYRNNNAKSPAIDAAELGEYNGILIGGGNDNLVHPQPRPRPPHRRHRHRPESRHDLVGLQPQPGRGQRGHQVGRSATSRRPAATATASSATRSERANPPTSSRRCRVPAPASRRSTRSTSSRSSTAKKPPSIDYRKAKTPPPPKRPGMAHPKTAKPVPANHIVVNVDLATVKVPALPASLR